MLARIALTFLKPAATCAEGRPGHAPSPAFPKQVWMSATALPPGGEAGRRDPRKMPGKGQSSFL